MPQHCSLITHWANTMQSVNPDSTSLCCLQLRQIPCSQWTPCWVAKATFITECAGISKSVMSIYQVNPDSILLCCLQLLQTPCSQWRPCCQWQPCWVAKGDIHHTMGGHHPTCHVKPDSTLFLLLTALLGSISKMFITQWADNISSISSLFYQSII